jgi:hypothetical protein
MGFRIELLLQIWIARTARTRAMRATSLRHEPINNAMEHDTIIETLFSELLDMRNVMRREIGAKFDNDITFCRL